MKYLKIIISFVFLFSIFFSPITFAKNHWQLINKELSVLPPDTGESLEEIIISDELDEIRIYPIPVQRGEVLSLDINFQNNPEVKVYITDMQGKSILEKNIPETTPFIETKELKQGSYLLKIVVGNKVITRRIVVIE